MNSSSSKICSAALKLDMNKAYDRVNWEFLWEVLRRFGFPPYWVHVLQQCVTTMSYQILVNGTPSQPFRPKCGLRQGDPLSLYLFVLCMEISSLILRRDEQRGLFQGLKISCRAPSVSYLFFADDALLFFRASPSACDQILSITNEFCSISGQMINVQKSFVKFSSNTPDDFRDYLSSTLRMEARSSLGYYLGLPVDLGRKKCQDFHFLLDKVAQRLLYYASLNLSSAEKLVIVNSVLVATFNHILSVFKVPNTVCERLGSMLIRFWWKSGKDSKGLALASSALLHSPEGLGGLGIRHLRSFNKALLAKKSWRLMRQPQLLASRIEFKEDIPDNDRPRVVAELLQKIDDFVYWKYTKDGIFSTKTAYNYLVSQHFNLDLVRSSAICWKRLWGTPLLPKWKMFAWKVMHNALPVSALLVRKGLPVDPICIFCRANSESIILLFWDCPLMQWLWGEANLTRLVAPFVSGPWPKWFSDCISALIDVRDWDNMDRVFGLLWAIWLTRNSVRFLSEVFSPYSILQLAFSWYERGKAARLFGGSCFGSPPGFHSSPLLRVLRGSSGDSCELSICFDGAWDAVTHCAGVSWCVVDSSVAPLVHGGARACMANSTLQAELMACPGIADITVAWVIKDIRALLDSFVVCHV
ncbi:uncharacterized protein LOC110715189 [Chenopodium quinoa]|uniref:uncharacterized protein LOC110715189 n=1 Tax=Chenopodium quinoa TaxID=63459 RepID=UPI000B770118|nr:uncharacterized protein LOC110715189 [Chenopodium quinoa]